ncbi:hypothetical protein Pse7367_1543 [Thalassoporum mexicanum PCC 7367]|uniref:hypothetical protein n=1 Tax=Thalassoporum mexicanum TaxID=3457544 RepID=UPI00029FA2DD|nr:hypothetical protein [Pseudanabaena sp. PCC 7367]AFY69832.1 hypothetical protein Pse7367_1543 [Pseudanabaena sp. PCC 7367]
MGESQQKNEQFDNFQALASKLFKVSKSEPKKGTKAAPKEPQAAKPSEAWSVTHEGWLSWTKPKL